MWSSAGKRGEVGALGHECAEAAGEVTFLVGGGAVGAVGGRGGGFVGVAGEQGRGGEVEVGRGVVGGEPASQAGQRQAGVGGVSGSDSMACCRAGSVRTR